MSARGARRRGKEAGGTHRPLLLLGNVILRRIRRTRGEVVRQDLRTGAVNENLELGSLAGVCRDLVDVVEVAEGIRGGDREGV